MKLYISYYQIISSSLLAARPNSVIDLTLDDDVETSKAIQASMDSVATFGPSNRIDTNQQWAMVPSVPSNVCGDECILIFGECSQS